MALQLGFEPRELLTARVDLPSPAYEDETRLITFSNALLEKLRALPGVQRVAVGSNPPLMTGWQTTFLPEGAPEPPPAQLPSAEMSVIMGDYFATLETPLLRGRSFIAQDTKDAPPVIIIDQLMADRYFPGKNPVGKRIRMQTDDKGRKMRTIIGVVPHLKVYGFDETTILPQAYLPQAQVPSTGLVLLLRTSLRPESLERTLRLLVASLDPSQPIFELQMMRDRLAETWSTPRLMSFLLTTFALLALSLALVGLYGVMAYNVLRRTREIGVRLALGARRSQISNMMLRQAIRLLVSGLLLGLTAAFVLSRLIRSLLFEANAGDPALYLWISALLGGTAVLACWLPARRAARVDPVITLRTE
jgi:putative ABC transport system permease protein